MNTIQITRLVKFHNQENMLDVVWLNPADVRTVMIGAPNGGPGTTIITTYGMPFVVAESSEEVAAIVQDAFRTYLDEVSNAD